MFGVSNTNVQQENTSVRELEESKESMTCAICMDLYEDPRVLNCSHSFCKSCLISYQAGGHKRECPTCRRPTVPFINEIESLPKNKFVSKVVELIKSHTNTIENDNINEGESDGTNTEFYIGEMIADDDSRREGSSSTRKTVIGLSVVAGATLAAFTGGLAGVLAGVAIAGIGTATSSDVGRAYRKMMNQEFTCDSCGKKDYYLRYKCGMCESFNICSTCFLNLDSLRAHDPQHLFLRLPIKPRRQLPPAPLIKEKGKDLIDSLVFTSTRHGRAYAHTPERLVKISGVKCKKCLTCPINGIRLKCGHCRNYDLCGSCGKSAEKFHDEDHVFIMIRNYAEVNIISEPLLKVKFY